VLASALRALGVAEPTQDVVTELGDLITVTADEDTRFVVISAESTSASEAAMYAQAVAEALILWDAQRPGDNLLKMENSLRQRIAMLDEQLAVLPAGPQFDGLVALRTEQVSQLATITMLS